MQQELSSPLGCFPSERRCQNLRHLCIYVCLCVCKLKPSAGWSKTKQDPGLQTNPEKYCGLETSGSLTRNVRRQATRFLNSRKQFLTMTSKVLIVAAPVTIVGTDWSCGAWCRVPIRQLPSSQRAARPRGTS